MKGMTTKDWLWLAFTVGSVVYGYGALNMRVSALESNNVPDMKTNIVVMQHDVAEIKADVKDIKKELRR